jgi:hypothetical protein
LWWFPRLWKNSTERCSFITESQTGRKKVKKTMKMSKTKGRTGHENGEFIKIPDDNPLTPNGHYSCPTAPLTSRRCILTHSLPAI